MVNRETDRRVWDRRSGRNLAGYRDDLQIVGFDISPRMLDVARQRARELGRQVEFHEGEAERLPFPDTSFDTVVCTLAVCAVADRNQALAEMYRVLRPGGRLLLLDQLERRWIRGRPADLAVERGFVLWQRQRLRLGLIERVEARRLA